MSDTGIFVRGAYLPARHYREGWLVTIPRHLKMSDGLVEHIRGEAPRGAARAARGVAMKPARFYAMWAEFLIVNLALVLLAAKVFEWPFLWIGIVCFFAAFGAGFAAIVIEDGWHT